MRKGFTVLELLVVIAIMAILLALTLAGIQNARSSASRARSMNNIRQLNLAFQNYSSTYGRLPAIVDEMNPDSRDRPPFFAILPLLEDNRGVFVSPADPSVEFAFSGPFAMPILPDDACASYAYNAMVFTGSRPTLDRITDGASHTIGLVEHYARCRKPNYEVFIFSLQQSGNNGGHRRPSFADKFYGDVLPVTASGTPITTSPSLPGVTFQCKPDLMESDARMPQTPHSGGMLIGMMDGAVRTVSAGVAPTVFWGAVTPNIGERYIDF